METSRLAPAKTWLFIQGPLYEGVSVSSVWTETEAGRRGEGVMARTSPKKVNSLPFSLGKTSTGELYLGLFNSIFILIQGLRCPGWP